MGFQVLQGMFFESPKNRTPVRFGAHKSIYRHAEASFVSSECTWLVPASYMHIIDSCLAAGVSKLFQM